MDAPYIFFTFVCIVMTGKTSASACLKIPGPVKPAKIQFSAKINPEFI